MSSDRRARTTPRGRCFPTGRRSSPGRRGGNEDDDVVEEMELVALDAETSRNDLGVNPDAFGDEQKLAEEGEEFYIAMN